jgi:hypothetical protein
LRRAKKRKRKTVDRRSAPKMKGGGLRQTLAAKIDGIDRKSLSEILDPDVDSGRLKLLMLFAVGEILCVITKVSVRIAAVDHIAAATLNLMLLVDSIKYALLLARNIAIDSWLCKDHAGSPNASAFAAKNRWYDSTLGKQGDIVLEVFMLLAVGTAFQTVSFLQLLDSYDAGFMVALAIGTQTLNMLSLVKLLSIMDNSHLRIKTICQFLQVAQVVELAYDIAVHIIYMSGDTQGLQGVEDVQTSASNSYHDLRLAGLVALISARLILQRFFSFKGRMPLKIYCEVLHDSVPNIDQPAGEGTQLEGEGEGAGGGAADAEGPPQTV